MEPNSVDISFISAFGSRGSGDGEFNYPTGITVTDSNLFVVDKQNHRIQKFDLNGVFVSEFGSMGSGDDNFFFPEGIANDGTYLYIVDSANHRIKTHDFNGAFVSEFGSRGSGNNEFNYPVGIWCDDGIMYVADKQNGRVTNHVFFASNWLYSNEINGLNFPEGVTPFDGLNRLAIVDSGNDALKIYYPNGTLVTSIENADFEYIVSVTFANDVLVVVDRQRGSIFNYSTSGNFIGEYSGFNYPIALAYADDKIYVTDSASHRVQILNYVVNLEFLFSLQSVFNLTRQLYPTGRSWWMRLGGIFDRFHQGLALSESRAYEESLGLLNKILPDNDSFNEEDAAEWEKALGLVTNTDLTLEERKANIERKIQFPGTILARQHYTYVQDELQKVGFDVYIHENRFPDGMGGFDVINPVGSLYGAFNYGQSNYGASTVGDYPKLANYIDEKKDLNFNFGSEENLRATFFVGGVNYGDRANVLESRKGEFRELLLKLKPAQTVGVLLIDYTV